jgi:hypothetical protein
MSSRLRSRVEALETKFTGAEADAGLALDLLNRIIFGGDKTARMRFAQLRIAGRIPGLLFNMLDLFDAGPVESIVRSSEEPPSTIGGPGTPLLASRERKSSGPDPERS